MATKTKAKTSKARKSGTSSTRSGGKKAVARKATTTAKKTAKAAARSPIGKAAAKVLAGAAAGAVRAIIPQLEDAAGSQEKIAGAEKPARKGGARQAKS